MATHKFIKLLALPVIAIPSFSFAAMVCTNYFDDIEDKPYKYGSSTSYFHNSCGLKTDDTVACWNSATGEPLIYPYMPIESGIKQLAAGQHNACVIKADDSVNCWPTYREYDYEKQEIIYPDIHGIRNVPINMKAKQISVGEWHACAVTLDNFVECWGWDANALAKAKIVPVPSGLQAKMVIAGYRSTCAITLNGRVQCWGSIDSSQQASKNLITNRLSSGIANFCEIDANDFVNCWGYTDAPINTVPTNLRAKQVDVGWHHACALKLDNTVQCWGSNAEGQANVPQGLVAQQIVAKAFSTCALKIDDTVQCWGRSYDMGMPSSELKFKHL